MEARAGHSLVFHHDRDRGGNLVHQCGREPAKAADESLQIQSPELKDVGGGSLVKPVVGIGVDANQPGALIERILPLGDRRDELDGQTANAVRADHHRRAGLAYFGAAGWVEVDEPDFAAKRGGARYSRMSPPCHSVRSASLA